MSRSSSGAINTRTRQLPLILVLLSLLGTALLLPVEAADAPPPPPDKADSSQPAVPAPAEPQPTAPDRPLSGSEQRRANDKGGVFRPSEDISEDLAVTFPVDI